jgi:hypothetical protein
MVAFFLDNFVCFVTLYEQQQELKMIGVMPNIAVAIENANLTPEQTKIAKQMIGRGGKLRVSKPKDGIAAYVWRLTAFYVSPNPQHQCMPCTADFGIPNSVCDHYPQTHSFQRRNAYIKAELEPIINAVVNEVPKEEWHSVRRWGKVLGAV